MINAIVFGATGFIGRWLVRELLKLDVYVVIICRYNSHITDDIIGNQNVEVIRGDINNLDRDAFPKLDYDVFYNLAWSGVDNAQKNIIHLQVENLLLSNRAVELASELNCNLFIGAGTVAEYSLCMDVMNPNERQRPNDIYGAIKVSVHHLLEVRARQLGIRFIWALIPSSYGEERTDNNIITYTIRNLLLGKPTEYGNLMQMWDFLYVVDVVDALVLLGEKGLDGVYGIGSGIYRPLKDYIITIRDLINPKAELGIGTLPEKSESTISSCVNNFRLIRDTGFTPKVSFEEGIKKTIKYWIKKLEVENETIVKRLYSDI